jgi:RHS repeat-associated protein
MLTGQAGTVSDSLTYDPAGNLLASTGTTKPVLGYDGELENWDTGLVYLQARVYDPSISQFLTRDPLDAQTGQAYEYAGDNPVNFEDPSGLCFVVSCNVYHSISNTASGEYQDFKAGAGAVGGFVGKHYGTILEGAGVVTCIVGTPVACAVVTAVSYAVNTFQNFSDDKSLQDKLADQGIDTLFLIPAEGGAALEIKFGSEGIEKVVVRGTAALLSSSGIASDTAASEQQMNGC